MGANTGLASNLEQRQMAGKGMQRQEDRMRQRGATAVSAANEELLRLQAKEQQQDLLRQSMQRQEALMRQRGAGTAFGPGRAMRVPPADSPEYQQMLERFRRG